MSLPRYPAYKDSGVAWLGEVPGHWEVKPFYSVAAEREEPNIGMQEDNLLSLSYGRIIQKDINSNDGLLPESFETYQVIRPGDIVFRLTDLQNDKRSLRTALVEETGIITSAYVASKPTNIEPRYLSQLLRAYDVTKVFYSMGGGLRQSMKFSDLKRLPTLLPPPEEQTAIAAFLDRETGKIDALVAEQERLVTLLKEKRQAVISHAVTKGLNPAAKMKDSGIEWLGEVPEHWEVKRLGYLCKKIGSGKTPSGGAEVYSEDGILFIRSQNVYDEGLRLDDVVFISEGIDAEMPWSRVLPGDILLNITGASLGRTCLVPEEFQAANVNQHVCIIRLEDPSQRDFVALVIKSLCVKTQIEAAQNGAAREGLNFEQISKLILALPPFEDQTAIAAFLGRETAKLDALTAEARRAIELLKERRSALISAAVTGKIDVRSLSPTPLPQAGEGRSLEVA